MIGIKDRMKNIWPSITLTQRQKKILMIGLAVLLAGAVYRFYPEIQGFFTASEALSIQQKQIEKYLRVVSQRKLLEKQKNQLMRELSRLEEKLFISDSPSLAAVDIQGIINDIIQTHQVNLQSIQILPSEDAVDLGYIVIPLKFYINCGIVQFKDIIYQIESQSKMLIIRAMDVEIIATEDPRNIRTTLTVEGIMKGNLIEGKSSITKKPKKE